MLLTSQHNSPVKGKVINNWNLIKKQQQNSLPCLIHQQHTAYTTLNIINLIFYSPLQAVAWSKSSNTSRLMLSFHWYVKKYSIKIIPCKIHAYIISTLKGELFNKKLMTKPLTQQICWGEMLKVDFQHLLMCIDMKISDIKGIMYLLAWLKPLQGIVLINIIF